MKAFLGEEFTKSSASTGTGRQRASHETSKAHVFHSAGRGELSIAIQALGLIAGARHVGEVCDFAHLFVAFDPGLFMPSSSSRRNWRSY